MFCNFFAQNVSGLDMYWCNENFPSLRFQLPIFEIISNKWRFVNQAIESIKNLNFRIFIQKDINPSDMQTSKPSCLLTLKMFSAEVRVGHFTSRPSDNYCLIFLWAPKNFHLDNIAYCVVASRNKCYYSGSQAFGGVSNQGMSPNETCF